MDINRKVLVVGLTPNYYSTAVRRAVSDYQASMRSTNMGASFITNSIVSIFDADYLDISSDFDMSKIRNHYDVCIISLASHLGPSRDVSQLVEFIKNVDLRTVFLSGGLDAGQNGSDTIHHSIKELLNLCSTDNQWIGVRGAASALYLHRQGVKNVVPIGCPTMFSKYSGEIVPSGIESNSDIAIPFHWSIAGSLLKELDEHILIGQDVMDEELFVEGEGLRISQNISARFGVPQKEVQKKLESAISSVGFFPNSYEAWYEKIGSQKALLSGRLHAAICGLTQGVPTTLTHWDLRTHELVDYFKLPSISGEQIRDLGALSAFKKADFDSFNQRQKFCWGRWSEFLAQNNIAVNNDCEKNATLSFKTALEHDNEILQTASCLYPHRSFGVFHFFKRVLQRVRRSPGLVLRKLGLS